MTFLTYNILDGGQGREADLIRILRDQAADVVLLQEVMAHEFVKTAAAQANYNFYIAESNSSRTIALLTRYPIQTASSYHPNILRHTCLHGVIEYAPAKTISIYGIHLCAPAYTLPLEIYRLLELNSIFSFVQQTRPERLVMAGDLNSIAPGDKLNFKPLPFSLRLSVFLHGGYVARQVITYLRMRGLMDVYRALNPNENGYTLPAAQPNTRLDYFFVNEPLAKNVRACSVITSPDTVKRASDHLPVRMELDI